MPTPPTMRVLLTCKVSLLHSSSLRTLILPLPPGQGCEQSGDKALRLLRQASDQGYLPSKMNLAQLYLEGIVVPKDAPTAKIFLSEVAGSNVAGSEKFREQAKQLIKELELAGKTGY